VSKSDEDAINERFQREAAEKRAERESKLKRDHELDEGIVQALEKRPE
jgi:hypothetical protein